MRFALLACLLVSAKTAFAAPFDLAAIRDPSTLETLVLRDWHPSQRDQTVQSKLIEITACEWWPGQKVRLPITFNVPTGVICSNIVVVNMGLAKKPAFPRPDELTLLKEHGVGIVMVGMGTIDAMEPKGQLHLGMKARLLKTRDPRYTPAWIWGLSQMRGLTAAFAERNHFRPGKVLSTGGSKRGVATAAAGIHDDRFTAIMPVVAPPLGDPGGPVVMGTKPQRLQDADARFYQQLAAGKLGLAPGIATPLRERHGRRAAQRVTLAQAQNAGWTPFEITTMTPLSWNVSRITDHLETMQQRGLEFFYCVGSNDSVTPALRELGRRFPDFPIYIVPGGQHGGPANAGFTRRTPLLSDVRENFTTFARHHFFGARTLPSAPKVVTSWNVKLKTLKVTAILPPGVVTTADSLWWASNRSEPFTLPFEYDRWESLEMIRNRAGEFTAILQLPEQPERLDILTVHKTIENDLPFTISSPYLRVLGR